MRICDVCKDTDQANIDLKEVELIVDGDSAVLVDEACPTCIEKVKNLLAPKIKPKFQHRDMVGPESLYGMR